MARLMKFAVYGFSVLFILALFGAGAGLYAFWYYGQDLPDHATLADYTPKISTRVHAGDGRFLTEFATEKRTFVPIEAIPRRVTLAFIAAEDQRFYQHKGVDPVALMRATITNVDNYRAGRRMVGGSTITQQVAKNFLVGNERRLERKVREAIIAMRMEAAFTKDEIIELYLNEIYLGVGSYGVAAAAQNYFNKSLDELTIAQAAYLAALPKAPGNYHPTRYPQEARSRRDWVIGRMQAEGFIDAKTAAKSMAEPLEMVERDNSKKVVAAYFTEEIRRELMGLYGETKLYEGGLSVRTTIDSRLQAIADAALRQELVAYDRRHGWRGPVTKLPAGTKWVEWLAEAETPVSVREWLLAVVLKIGKDSVTVGLKGGGTGVIPITELAWAREVLEDQAVGPEITSPKQVLAVGDVVLTEPVTETPPDEEGVTKPYPEGTYGLRQIPNINGGIVALDPHTGRVLAMSGGYDFGLSEFNRATQAWRQPGSAFKPFVYLAALDKGFTPATVILDAPFVLDQGEDKGRWKPTNYSSRFYGPSTMRLGIEKSRNLMTVRLGMAVGMTAIIENAKKFNIVEDMPRELAMALGAGETTLMRLTTAYAMLANGGKRITPTLIDRVQDRKGKTVFKHDNRPCQGCRVERWNGQPVPQIPDEREQVSDPISTYQIVSMLEGVVRRGTGYRASSIGKPLGGKTGTTNESQDTWFIGFSPDLVAGVFVGFDAPRNMGQGETGSSAALPVFKRFMEQALADRPARPFPVPPGIRTVRINTENGLPARPGDPKVVDEVFRIGTEPSFTRDQVVIDGSAGTTGIAKNPQKRDRDGNLVEQQRRTETGLY